MTWISQTPSSTESTKFKVEFRHRSHEIDFTIKSEMDALPSVGDGVYIAKDGQQMNGFVEHRDFVLLREGWTVKYVLTHEDPKRP